VDGSVGDMSDWRLYNSQSSLTDLGNCYGLQFDPETGILEAMEDPKPPLFAECRADAGSRGTAFSFMRLSNTQKYSRIDITIRTFDTTTDGGTYADLYALFAGVIETPPVEITTKKALAVVRQNAKRSFKLKATNLGAFNATGPLTITAPDGIHITGFKLGNRKVSKISKSGSKTSKSVSRRQLQSVVNFPLALEGKEAQPITLFYQVDKCAIRGLYDIDMAFQGTSLTTLTVNVAKAPRNKSC
jgi:hypothetical protein